MRLSLKIHEHLDQVKRIIDENCYWNEDVDTAGQALDHALSCCNYALLHGLTLDPCPKDPSAN